MFSSAVGVVHGSVDLYLLSARRCRRRKPLLFASQFAKVALDLEPVPKLVGLAEERAQADGQRRGNRASRWTISLIARGATPMARAIALGEIPMGLRYSSSRISPGVIGLSIFDTRSTGDTFPISASVGSAFERATGNIPVGRFYASYPSDCTYKVNSGNIKKICDKFFVICSNTMPSSAHTQRPLSSLQIPSPQSISSTPSFTSPFSPSFFTKLYPNPTPIEKGCADLGV